MAGGVVAARVLTRLGALAAVALALGGAAARAAPDAATLRAEAFVAAQQAMTSEAGDALAKLSARFAAGSGGVDCRRPEPAARELPCLAEAREAEVQRRTALQARMERLYGETGAEAEAARAALRAQIAEADRAAGDLEAKLRAQFPAYSDLVNPAPLSLAETQRLLGPKEALLLIFVDEDASYVWAVSAAASAWARSEALNGAALTAKTEALRASLAGAAGARADIVEFGAAARFDEADAQALYDGLIRPVEGVLPGPDATLIVVASGALRGLPLSVLKTGPGPTDWLIDRYALASLPSVPSLKALRCHLAAQPAAGCGNPTGAPRRGTGAANVSLVGFGAPRLEGAPESGGAKGGGDPAEVFSGRLADPAKLRSLAYLPGAERELAYLSSHVTGAVIRTGARATETAVRVDERERLAAARYVIFSTHGLLASSAALADEGVGEPGLVLTPPAQATEADDGYLSASEAAQLRLSAEFVILSACNTAGSDGRPGGEGLSGLARAFFYAGARSLLVSHWAVNDEATTQLITSVFNGLDQGDAISRAGALRQAMLKVRAAPDTDSPYYWAAFDLVGEPGAAERRAVVGR